MRKVELFEEEDTCGLTLVSSYPASYSLDTMREALEKLCTPHMTLTLDPTWTRYSLTRIPIW